MTETSAPTPAIADFLKGLAAGSLGGTRAAAFDTRIVPGKETSGFLRFIVRASILLFTPVHSAWDIVLSAGLAHIEHRRAGHRSRGDRLARRGYGPLHGVGRPRLR